MFAIKKPIEIQFWPFERQFFDEIRSWSNQKYPIQIVGERYPKAMVRITTLEGEMTGIEGKVIIIRGVDGEVYPCKKEIFDKTYRIIKENESKS